MTTTMITPGVVYDKGALTVIIHGGPSKIVSSWTPGEIGCTP
jgi:hypothetical protein